jgi:DNA-binding LytR/AlgR family response regulator
MKTKIIIDPSLEVDLTLIFKEESSLIDKIKQTIDEYEISIKGMIKEDIYLLNLSSIQAFIIENSKVYALDDDKKYLIKYRLYQLEEFLPPNFLKINQSCLVNIKKINHFSTSLTGSIKVILDNNYEDYISRRLLNKVKERIGL